MDKRREERVSARFAVTFRELTEAQAEELTGMEAMPELPVAPPAPPAGTATAGHPPGQGGQGQTENISSGGLSFTGDLQILGDKRLERGAKMLVEFTLPGQGAPLRALAVVAWTLEGHGSHGKFTAGLMFLGIAPEDLVKIQGFIEDQATIEGA